MAIAVRNFMGHPLHRYRRSTYPVGLVAKCTAAAFSPNCGPQPRLGDSSPLANRGPPSVTALVSLHPEIASVICLLLPRHALSSPLSLSPLGFFRSSHPYYLAC